MLLSPVSPIQCTRSNCSIIPMRNHPSFHIISQLIRCSTKSVKDWTLGTIGTTRSKCEWHHAAGVFSSLVNIFFFGHLTGVPTPVFGFTTNFSVDTEKPSSQTTTTTTSSHCHFICCLPPEPLDCRRATCCSRVSLVMFSSSSSDRASAISPHSFKLRLPVAVLVSVAAVAAALLPSAAPPPGSATRKWSRLKTRRAAATRFLPLVWSTLLKVHTHTHTH